MSPPTLLHALGDRAQAHPARPLYTWLDGGEREGTTLAYGEVWRRALAVGAALAAEGVARGERALMLYPPGLDFIIGFYGCMAAGVIPVPAYPPEPARLSRTLPRLRAIVADARPAVVLTTGPVAALGRAACAELAPEVLTPRWLATDGLDPALGDGFRPTLPAPGDLAFVQYTSGSTSDPKGVLVSHGNLACNIAGIIVASRSTPDTRAVSWLPQYHDMGLITGLLTTMVVGGRTFAMSPLDFLARPMRWLEAMSRHQATVSGGPNFAWDLCARRAAEARGPLDLSRWMCAYSAAERVRPETLERFAAAFGGAGFRRAALMPCYGLAEATVGVSWSVQEEPRVLELDAAALQAGRAEPAPGGLKVAGLGRAINEEQAPLIVDPETLEPVAEGRVGEIWCRGPSVAQGYWGRPEETAATFGARTADGQGPFLRTGDLGFLHGGELYMTGRRKELIIVRGANHYPTDIEATIEDATRAARPGCVAAFAMTVDGVEELAVVAELRKGAEGEAAAIAGTMRAAVAAQHDLSLHAVVLLPAGTIPKTTSGKLMRRATRDAFLTGALAAEAILISVSSAGGAGAARGGLLDELLAVDGEERVRRLAAALAIEVGARDVDARLLDAGLDSLRSTELAARLEHELGVGVPLTRLLAGPTLMELARELAPRVSRPAPAVAAAAGALASEAQRAIHADHARWPGSVSVSAAVQLDGPLDAGALDAAALALRARHPLLGSCFIDDGGGLRAAPLAGAPGLGVDLALSEGDLPAALALEAARPFDLGREAPMRLSLYHLGGGRRVLQITLHHLAYDALSAFLVCDELFALYRRGIGASAEELPPARPYDEFIAHEQRYLASPRCERDRAYWHERLRGADLRSPLGPSPAAAGRMRQSARRLPEGLSAALRRAAARQGTTLYVALLTGYASALADCLGREELVLGTSVSLRDAPELRSVVGPVMNFVALRLRPRAARGFLAPVGALVAEALEHRAYPFGRLVDELTGGDASLPRLGLHANFNFYDVAALAALSDTARLRAGATVELGPVRATHLPIADVPVVRPYDLTCGVWNSGGELALQVRVREGLREGRFADELLGGTLARLADLAG